MIFQWTDIRPGVWGWFWFFVAIFLQFPQVLDLTNAVRTSVAQKPHLSVTHRLRTFVIQFNT